MLPIHNLNLTLLKQFNIKERKHFQTLAEAMNLFNHPQYIPGTPNASQLPNNYRTRRAGGGGWFFREAVSFW